MFNNFFPKTAPLIILKNTVQAEGPYMTSQYGAYALHAAFARLYTLIRMQTLTRPGTKVHEHNHTQTHK